MSITIFLLNRKNKRNKQKYYNENQNKYKHKKDTLKHCEFNMNSYEFICFIVAGYIVNAPHECVHVFVPTDPLLMMCVHVVMMCVYMCS